MAATLIEQSDSAKDMLSAQLRLGGTLIATYEFSELSVANEFLQTLVLALRQGQETEVAVRCTIERTPPPSGDLTVPEV